MNITLQDS